MKLYFLTLTLLLFSQAHSSQASQIKYCKLFAIIYKPDATRLKGDFKKNNITISSSRISPSKIGLWIRVPCTNPKINPLSKMNYVKFFAVEPVWNEGRQLPK